MPNDKRELKIFKMSRISSGIRHSSFLCHWVLRHSQVSDHEERMLPSIRAYLSGVYEWWIPGCSDGNWRSVPWYSGETALRNLRYWKAHGIRYLTYEPAYENGNGFPIRWPLYYVGARGAWNTDLTSGRIMTEACEKLYGSASAHMFEFYRIFELAMAVCNEPGGNWNLPNPEKVYSPNVEAEATAHLQRAAQATDDPKALARIAEEQKMWDEAHWTLANLRF